MNLLPYMSKQKGCPDCPLVLEWCFVHEGQVQWTVTQQLAVVTMSQMKQMSTGWLCFEKDIVCQKGFVGRVQKGVRRGAVGFGKCRVPQRSAQRSSVWEACSCWSYCCLPPTSSLRAVRKKESFFSDCRVKPQYEIPDDIMALLKSSNIKHSVMQQS